MPAGRDQRKRREYGAPRWAESRRLQVCEETARIMVEQGIRDFQIAKAKAVERMGVGSRCPLPSNREIEHALERRLRLFGADRLSQCNKVLLGVASDIMARMIPFNPRLVGALVRGTVTARTPVELHAFAETPEEICHRLQECGIVAQSIEKRMRFAPKRYRQIPGFCFDRDRTMVEVMAFETNGIREAPLCPVAAKPMRRVPLPQVRAWLACL